MKRKKVSAILTTDGKGFWSNVAKKIAIHKMELHNYDSYAYKNNILMYGELRVYFNKKTWNTKKHGLIYTDNKFLSELRKYLIKNGFSKKAAYDVDYSEQGMQGDNYISLDADVDFIKDIVSNKNKIKITIEKSI